MDKHLHPDHSCETCKPLRPANSALWGPQLGRREFFQIAGTGVTGFFLAPLSSKLFEARAETNAAQFVGRAKNVIFIHMQGAPSHVDTFDLKVGSWTPADFNPTAYNGIMFPQGLMPNLATHLSKIAIVRSLRAPALVHSLQQVWSQIARNPTSLMGKIAPNIGSVVALEFESKRQPNQKLPGFISLNGGSTVGSGYFNARYSPFAATAAQGGLAGLTHPDGQANFDRRFQMLADLDGPLRANSPMGEPVVDMENFYQQSRAMMYNPAVDSVFKFTADEQTRYGNSGFGNSLIVARNLVKANLGTRHIQVNIGGWDNHTNIYTAIRNPATQFDRGLGALLTDLSSQPGVQGGGTLLDETLIVGMGEFGRTVRGPAGVGLNNQNGRDHFFQHFTMFAGGGIIGGRVVGSTTADGYAVQDPGWSQNRPVANEDIAATIYSALGIDYTKTLWNDPYQRGFDYVPFAAQGAWYPVTELFTRAIKQRPKTNPRGGGKVS
ncbi:MAG: hypothetical protein JMDDDDMK_05345 [Acidobacteria bacterium]|nr:hypothetical protein [Acidobacteriota bacterium]